MKRIVSTIFAFMLTLSFAFSITACGDNSSSGGISQGGSVNNDDKQPSSGSSDNVGDVGIISPINVIMVNDNHGILNEEKGGIDKIASGIDYYASQGDVVKIANGDMFQGTYVSSTLRGLPMLDALNAMEFDAFVIGNHEFDWGLDEMEKYKDGDISNGEADFPFLGANIYEKSTGEMVDWLDPYTVVELDKIKIGIIGIIGDVESSILSSHVKDYEFVDPREIVKDYAIELRADKGCDVVIVAIHGDDDGLNAALATYVDNSRIDAIFTGHSHIPTNEEITRADGSRICVLQNGGYGESFASLTLEFDENKKIINSDGKLNSTDAFNSTGILSTVFEKYGEYISIGEEVILSTEYEVSRYDVGLSVVYSMYVKYDVAYAFINSGGVRTGIDAGEVTYADLFQILPFENEVYLITMKGSVLRNYLNNSGSIYYWGIGTNAIDDEQEYQISIVDYLFQSSFFDDFRTETYIDTNDLIRDVFIAHIVSQ